MAFRGRLGRRGPDHDLLLGRERPTRQMLISMLMTGSTDSAIANTLNINVRSVRRWISDLMDELGVATRLQLGACDRMVCAESLRGLTGRAPLRESTESHARGPKSTAGVAQGEELRAEPRGKFHTGCAGQATLTRSSTTGNVRYPGFLAEDLVLALPMPNTIGDLARFH